MTNMVKKESKKVEVAEVASTSLICLMAEWEAKVAREEAQKRVRL